MLLLIVVAIVDLVRPKLPLVTVILLAQVVYIYILMLLFMITFTLFKFNEHPLTLIDGGVRKW